MCIKHLVAHTLCTSIKIFDYFSWKKTSIDFSKSCLELNPNIDDNKFHVYMGEKQ